MSLVVLSSPCNSFKTPSKRVYKTMGQISGSLPIGPFEYTLDGDFVTYPVVVFYHLLRVFKILISLLLWIVGTTLAKVANLMRRQGFEWHIVIVLWWGFNVVVGLNTFPVHLTMAEAISGQDVALQVRGSLLHRFSFHLLNVILDFRVFFRKIG
ncbi:hypothetical protein AVEN_266241-1 [Araneus ventricosus]|uniref:Uncharacterized protein n=1 Tax=Araneus ventricosus TaxID=182803 RepID=A0A4Y2R2Q3_ARAVE|nr:hypothetical protein AVEN_266241-1 [Araneus ventricosus]